MIRIVQWREIEFIGSLVGCRRIEMLGFTVCIYLYDSIVEMQNIYCR